MAVLVITEKPSVARSIGSVIGAVEKKDGYLEGAGYFVSWCIGHLVGLAAADAYDVRYSKWDRDDLPILPEPWKFTIAPDARKQFAVLKGLMGRQDVTELVEATDAGREGELIFRLVCQQARCRKPFRRLWISSMEDDAIREGFLQLRPGADYDTLYDAALCRAKADWLVGINATRLFTTLYRGRTLNVGRVMTPTLALLTEREEAAVSFLKEKFYMVELDLGTFRAVSGRFSSKTDAQKRRKACLGKPVSVQDAKRQEKTEKPPKLYDLTSLQREANRIFGYTAQQTLDYAQSLYEKKLLTYPRTDSRYLTADLAAGLSELCRAVACIFPFLSEVPCEADASQVTDSSKVSDHHAIIPTKEADGFRLETLPTGERSIFSLACRRFLCAVCPDNYHYVDTSVILSCAGTEFTAKCRTELSAGWKRVEQAFLTEWKVSEKKMEKEPVFLPELSIGQVFSAEAAMLREGTTSPPERYTDDSLLLAMQNAGAEEFEKIGDVERSGLGTPATRAGIIEKLVKCGFVERKQKSLVPTVRGIEFVKVLPEVVKSAKLTAEWEAALKEVERGERPPESFLQGIAGIMAELVKSYENVTISAEDALFGLGREALGKCPRCGKPVYEGKKSFYCSGYQDSPPCGFALWKDNLYFKSKRKELDKESVAAFLKDGKVKMTGLYSEKKGVLYDATIVMEDTGDKYVKFRLEFDRK